jgi:ABC-type nitrate/sulfonate/bicarbonate transport system substrate-binding protein
VNTNQSITFGITPFYVTRQYYYALEQGIVEPKGIDLNIEHYHSPVKDHVILCGDVDVTTMSIGKYTLAKTISDTYTLPVDPFAVSVGLTYENGNGLFVHADSNIETPQDLVGTRLGIHDKTAALVYHKAILEDLYDVSVDEIEWVFDTHQNLTRMMENREIDAIERVGDWYWNLRTSSDHTMLYDMGEKWNEMEGYDPIVHLITTSKRLYDEQPVLLDSFVDALQESREYRNEHYEDILTAFTEEEASNTEWTGSRTVDDLREITQKAKLPFTFDDTQKRNVRDWMEYAVRFDVVPESIPEERLYPL